MNYNTNEMITNFKKTSSLITFFVLLACGVALTILVPQMAQKVSAETAKTGVIIASSEIFAQAASPPDTTTNAPVDTPKTLKNDCNDPALDQNNCAIIRYLVLFIKALSGIVGIVVVASIIIGGIQYTVSGDDAAAVTAAKKRIFNAILALAIYIFTFAILQYLVPGGVIAL